MFKMRKQKFRQGDIMSGYFTEEQVGAIVKPLQEKIKELENEITRLKEINVYGWKGKDKLEIYKEGTNWILKEHRKDKDSGEIALISHIVPELNVVNVWNAIRIRCVEIGEKTNSRKIAIDLITQKNIPLGLDEFWGGKNRAQYLFPLLYYPLKILEEKGFIKYGGRGQIIRLKK